MRLTMERWSRVPTDVPDVYNYPRRVEVVAVAGTSDDLRTFVKDLTDDEIVVMRPLVSRLALALSAEQALRTIAERAAGPVPDVGPSGVAHP